jgi:hypothetical protein
MSAQEEADIQLEWDTPRVIPQEKIQREANDLLDATDWVHLPDVNISVSEKNAILAFRQAVQAVSHSPRPRDLGFPPLENRFKRNGR